MKNTRYEASKLAKFLDWRILELAEKKNQREIAIQAGFPNPNHVSMLKAGSAPELASEGALDIWSMSFCLSLSCGHAKSALLLSAPSPSTHPAAHLPVQLRTMIRVNVMPALICENPHVTVAGEDKHHGANRFTSRPSHRRRRDRRVGYGGLPDP